jgi:hypothetical protein
MEVARWSAQKVGCEIACSGQLRISALRTTSVRSPSYKGEEKGDCPFWVKHPLFAQDVFIA